MVYLDNSATTKISKEVYDEINLYLTEEYGNPSSIYKLGVRNKNAIHKARNQIANAINCDANEVFFTSGGTESDNWAIRGILQNTDKKTIITTTFEHPAVYNTCKALEKQGYTIKYIQPDTLGIINPQDIENAITDDVALVSVMYVNNEIGTIQPIKEIGKICKKHHILFHTDAVQAIGYVPINVKEQYIDMLSMSGHKFHAPKGIGCLYVSKDIKFSPLIYGGGQEKGMRSGTENIVGIVGIGKAIELATHNLESKIANTLVLRDWLLDNLLLIGGIKVNGSITHRSCCNISIAIDDVESESLVLLCDNDNLFISAGSACASNKNELSRTLQSIGLKEVEIVNTIRISLCDNTTFEEVKQAYTILKKNIEFLRKMRNGI